MTENRSQHNPSALGTASGASLARGFQVAVIGSLVGTLVMDLVMVGEFYIAKLPPTTYLALIGSLVGGGVALGVIGHVALGTLLGRVFGALELKVDALRIVTVARGVWLGVLAGLATIPLCVAFAILAGVPVVQLLSFSIIPHLVWGAVVGIFAGYGMRSPVAR